MATILAATTRAQAQAPAERTVEAWMNEWMSEQRLTVGTLHLSRFVEPVYFLLKPTVWLPDVGQEHLKRVNVPIGFVTDFASIPSLFWSILRPDGKYTHPAIVHDYLYWTQMTSREDADAIFQIMMDDFGVGSVTAGIIHTMVRSFGGSSWEDNARLKAAGERRVLKNFPDSATATWAQWKSKPENFL